jgi:hypothetical protein
MEAFSSAFDLKLTLSGLIDEIVNRSCKEIQF